MSAVLPDEYEVRPARAGDLDDVVRLAETVDRAFGLPLETTREFLSRLWNTPGTDLERDTRVVLVGETVVAFAQSMWWPEEGGPLILSWVATHPEHRGAGIETTLLSWGEDLARARGTDGIRVEVVDRDEPGHERLRSRGYRQVRSFFTMWRGLGEDEEEGTVPAGVRIRPYEDADERAFFEVHEASFADHWEFRPTSFEAFNENLHAEGWDPSLAFLAEAGGEAVGLVATFLNEKNGYVALLGVIPSRRGRGIAKALLMRSFAELAARGRREVRLDVDAEGSYGAVALYEGVGMSVHRRYDMFDLATTQVRNDDRP